VFIELIQSDCSAPGQHSGLTGLEQVIGLAEGAVHTLSTRLAKVDLLKLCYRNYAIVIHVK
jgi:hypothetical protein